MKSFETFRESIAKLDILIETKKQEYKETTENLELNHKNQVKKLEAEYSETNKKLRSEYDELKKKLESKYSDRNKFLNSDHLDKTKKLLNNTYEDLQLDIKRKIAEDKSKQCELYAKELKMKFIKEEEHKALMVQVQKALSDFNELKKSFDKQCDMIRNEEMKKLENIMHNLKMKQQLLN